VAGLFGAAPLPYPAKPCEPLNVTVPTKY
jgi:hypothetical protein